MFTNLFNTFISPYMLYIKIGLIVAGVAALGALYFAWEASIKKIALMEFNSQTQEQIIKDLEHHAYILQNQIDLANLLVDRKQKELDQIKKTLDTLEEIVQNAHQDGDADPLLKDTIEAIRKSRTP